MIYVAAAQQNAAVCSAETLPCGQWVRAAGPCLAGLKQRTWAPMAKLKLPDNEEGRRAWIKGQKAKGVRVFKGRTGWVAIAAPLPKNRATATTSAPSPPAGTL